MMEGRIIDTLQFPGVKFFKRGKVREIYDFGEKLLMVATDRISCFDVVLPTPIPCKGAILTQISEFWFEFTKDVIPNHLITTNVDDFPQELSPYKDDLRGRSTLVEKAKPIPIECVVRGYLSGSGWKEYKENQTVCGIPLPPGLSESGQLPQPIFTPATKEEAGHDINVTQEYMIEQIGRDLAARLKDLSIALYHKAGEYAASRGIIIADTKFEFGLLDKEIILIDEVLTPDSSRFWPRDQYEPGRPQASFDKQYVRDYLETLDWDKTYPGPQLPDEVVAKTKEKYLEALKMITGKGLD